MAHPHPEISKVLPSPLPLSPGCLREGNKNSFPFGHVCLIVEFCITWTESSESLIINFVFFFLTAQVVFEKMREMLHFLPDPRPSLTVSRFFLSSRAIKFVYAVKLHWLSLKVASVSQWSLPRKFRQKSHEISWFFHKFVPENLAKFNFFLCNLSEALP